MSGEACYILGCRKYGAGGTSCCSLLVRMPRGRHSRPKTFASRSISPPNPGCAFRGFPNLPVIWKSGDIARNVLSLLAAQFALNGFDYGFAGHISVRDPEFTDLYWTNPMAVHFSRVKLSNLILANHEGDVVAGDYALNQAGFVLHASVHKANPDIVAMCHAHTIHGTAFSSLGRPLDPISQDAACFFEDHAVANDEGGAVTVFEIEYVFGTFW